MRITEKGQVTIPVKLRKRFGLDSSTEIEFSADEGGIRITKRGGAAANPFRGLRGVARKRLAPHGVDAYIETIRGR